MYANPDQSIENLEFYRTVQKKQKSNYYILIFCLYLFLLYNPLDKLGLPLIRCSDEIIAICAIILAASSALFRKGTLRAIKNNLILTLALIILCCAGILGTLIFKYQTIYNGLQGLLLTSKFWLGLYFGLNLFKNLSLAAYADKLARHIRFITVVFILLFFADMLLDLFRGDYRYGLKSATLFYDIPSSFAISCAFLLAIHITISGSGKKQGWVTFSLVLMIMMTLRSKAIASAIVFVLLYVLIIVGKKKVSIASLIVIGVIVSAIAWNQFRYYFVGATSDSARSELLAKSFQIAADHYPLGSGFGTFGSYVSGEHYSPIYYIYNLYKVNGLQEGGAFFSDCFWAMIIGEAGYFGALAYLYLLYWLLKKIQPLWAVNKKYYLSGIFMMFYLLISSTSEAAFAYPNALPMAIWIGVFN